MQANVTAHRGKGLFFEGWLVAMHRIDEASNRLLLKTCNEASGCPVWIETQVPVTTSIGSRVEGFGELVGVEEYANLDGNSRRALLLTKGRVSP